MLTRPRSSLSLDRVDVAAGRRRREAHPRSDGVEHLGDVERGAELQTRLREHAELAVGLREPLQQQQVVEGARHGLGDAAREVEVLVEPSLAQIEDVDEPDKAAVDDEREESWLANPARAQTPRSSAREPRVGGPGENEDLVVADDGPDSRSPLGEDGRRPGVLAAASRSMPARKRRLAALDRVDLAVGGAQDVEQALGDERCHLLGPARAR